MKLDVTPMRYLSRDDFRVLVAIEMAMRNHELAPIPLIAGIAKLRHGGLNAILSTLLKFKLVAHENVAFDGYRLSYLGYDLLALKTLCTRGVIESVGHQIGVGKEADVFEALDCDGNEIIIKIHRLGRTSFRAVRKTRDYLEGKSKASWLYMSRIAATKEFAYMVALYDRQFPTPIPISHNRHIIAMSKVKGYQLSQVRSGKPEELRIAFDQSVGILTRLLMVGLVHCDYNEFNLLVDDTGRITMIDFPQMVSTQHPNAKELFERDMESIRKFFCDKLRYIPTHIDAQIDFDEVVAAQQQEALIAKTDAEFEAMEESATAAAAAGMDADALGAENVGGGVASAKVGDIAGEGKGGDASSPVESLHKEKDTIDNVDENAVEGSDDDDSDDAGDDLSRLEGESTVAGGLSVSERVRLERSGPGKRSGKSKGAGNGGKLGQRHEDGQRTSKSRNETKKRNKYGKIVRENKIELNW